ncbi:MAG: LUD domain-containing protein [Caulobacteraceae bacterium]
MSSRESIFAAIRANRPSGQHDLPVVPRFNVPEADNDRMQAFKTNLVAMGGKLMDAGPVDDHLAPLRVHLATAAVVCSATPEINGTRDLAAVAKPHDLADVDIAVVRAAFGVAETGSVLLTESELHINALAYLAQHLVVLLDPNDIVASTQDAYRRPEFHAAHYASFHTGPSATADIEGVLIHGAQGVRSLTVLLSPRE